jgi:hypothetical protein
LASRIQARRGEAAYSAASGPQPMTRAVDHARGWDQARIAEPVRLIAA